MNPTDIIVSIVAMSLVFALCVVALAFRYSIRGRVIGSGPKVELELERGENET